MRGGTNAKMAPQVDYADRVFRPTAARFGIDFDLEVVRRGFYPQGNGQAVMNVRPGTWTVMGPVCVCVCLRQNGGRVRNAD